MNGPGSPPARQSKVSGYTNSAMMTTRTLPSLMICAMVMLTDSVNSNMGFLHERASAEAPAPAIKRALVGGYEVFSRFTSGNGLPLLTTKPQGCEPCGDCLRMRWPASSRCRSGNEDAQVFQFFMHNAIYASLSLAAADSLRPPSWLRSVSISWDCLLISIASRRCEPMISDTRMW